MPIETEMQIIKQIGIRITEEDVDGFLEDLKELFTGKRPVVPKLSQARNIFPTLFKIWLEVKQE